jgi:polysaccharide pyruvyl transferase WcaK-like protein
MIVYPSRIKKNNLGDVLINTLLIRELSKFSIILLDGEPSFNFDLLTKDNPFGKNIHVVKGPYFLQGMPVLRWFLLIRHIKKINFAYDPPGAYGINNKGSILKKVLKFSKYFLRATILNSLNIKVVRFGISLDCTSTFALKTEKILSKKYYFIGIRDDKNYNFLKVQNFKNIHLVEDLAYLYQNEKIISTTEQLIDLPKKYVVVSLRGAISGDKIDKVYFDFVYKALMVFIKKNQIQSIVLTYQVSEDLEIIKEISRLLPTHINHKLIENQLDLKTASYVYRNSEFVITNRLHVALLSLLNDKISFVLTDIINHPKICNIYRNLQLDEFIIRNDEMEQIKTPIEMNTAIQKFKEIKKMKGSQLTNLIESLTKI